MMLPGVEYARRRRFHQGGGGLSTPRDSTHNNKCGRPSHFSPELYQTTTVITESQREKNGDYKLHKAALEARERLEEKLRSSGSRNERLDHYRKMHLQQNNGNHNEEVYHGIQLEQIRAMNNRDLYSGSITDATQPRDVVRQNMKPSPAGLPKESMDLLRTEIYARSMRKGKSLLSGTSEPDNCPICLECFQHNQLIIHLFCGHKFHSSCLIPWLDENDHCPYCRAQVSTKTS